MIRASASVGRPSPRAPAPLAPPPAKQTPAFADCAWVVSQWLRALQSSPAAQAAQCHALRALVPLIHQAHAALGDTCAWREVQTWVSRIETELTCPLHHGLMQAPAALACGHVFEDAWLSNMPVAANGTQHCPTCRTQARKVAPPVALLQILHTLRAFYGRIGQPIDAVDAPPDLLATGGSQDDATSSWLASDTLQGIMGAIEGDGGADIFRRPLPDTAAPLLQAAMAGDVARVQGLVATLAAQRLDVRGSGGITALHIAAYHNDVEVAGRLLRGGATVDIQDDADSTPLHLAAARGNVPMIQLLLAHGADIHASDPSALSEAIVMGQVAAVRALLEAQAHAGLRELEAGLLLDAVLTEEPEMVRMLLAAGCDLGETIDPLGLAMMQEPTAVFDVLLEAYAQADAPHREDFGPVLCVAAECGRVDIVRKLLAAGADVDTRSSDGSTPLHLAMANAAPQAMVQALLQGGARRDVHDAQGQTPAALAAQHGCSEDVLALFTAADTATQAPR